LTSLPGYTCYKADYILQGSVATYLRLYGIFNDRLIARIL